jgi:hypothetical protein
VIGGGIRGQPDFIRVLIRRRLRLPKAPLLTKDARNGALRSCANSRFLRSAVAGALPPDGMTGGGVSLAVARMPLCKRGTAGAIGILRLHLSCASRGTNSALDDSPARIQLASISFAREVCVSRWLRASGLCPRVGRREAGADFRRRYFSLIDPLLRIPYT